MAARDFKSPRDLIGIPVGIDFYNREITGEKTMTLSAARSDPHHVPCAMIPYTLKIRGGCEGGGAKAF